GQGQEAQGGTGRRRVQSLRVVPLRAAREARVRDRAPGHRGQGAARRRRAAEGRLRAHPRRRAVPAQRPHPALRSRRARQSRARARSAPARTPPPDRQARRAGQGEGADARPDADLLQRRTGEGRDRGRQGQGPVRQAPVDQGARVQARHGPGAAGGPAL
ncbi:MAG: tmRNA-binding protein SmpB, partial [uncultured Solirubrobacteraceae bacterium]